MLLTRNLDVSVGSMMGFAAYLTADFAATHPAIAPWQLVLIPLVIGAALGAINGLLVAYGKVPALIATLGTMSLYRGLTYVYAHGQEVTSSRLPPWMLTSVDARLAGLPLLVVAAAAIVLIVWLFLQYYPLGRRIYAVGSNPLASFYFGLRSERVVLLAYVICGVLCGAAGLLYAARVGTVTVVLASGWEMSSLAAAVIGGVSVSGGTGSVIGAALGAVVLATIDNGLVLLAVPEFWRMFIQGVAIIAAVAADAVIASGVGASLRSRRGEVTNAKRGSALGDGAGLGADAVRADRRRRRLVVDPVALLPQPRPDLQLDALLHHPRPAGARAGDGGVARRDRHLARFDHRRRHGRAVEILDAWRADRRRRADRHRHRRVARDAQRRAGGALSAAVARGDARGDGRLSRARLHHRQRGRLHQFRRILLVAGVGAALGRHRPGVVGRRSRRWRSRCGC